MCPALALHKLAVYSDSSAGDAVDRVSRRDGQGRACLQQLGAGSSSRAALVQASLTPFGKHVL